MKKTSLLISACLTAGVAFGQSVPFKNHERNSADNQITSLPSLSTSSTGNQSRAYKTTTGPGGSRWYSYVDSFLALNPSTCSATSIVGINVAGLTLWNDTTAVIGYTGTTATYSGNSFTSAGMGFYPYSNTWNNPTNFNGEVAITSSTAFTIDSVTVRAWYDRNLSRPSVVDTLILTFVQGTSADNLPNYYFTGMTGDYCSDTVHFLALLHDSTNNRGGNLSGSTVVPVPTSQVYKFLLTSADTNGSNFNNHTVYPRPGHTPADPVISFPVTAGNAVAMSITYKSGDATYPTSFLTGASGAAFPGHKDTIRTTSATAITGYKYNNYDLVIAYNGDPTTGDPSFAPYGWPDDKTSGYFKKENSAGWGGQYIPNWAWSSSGTPTGASVLQFPYVNFHVNCPTCYTVGSSILETQNVNSLANNIVIAPNPSDEVLNVTLNGAQYSKAVVSLTNMVGQVVATQATTTGHASINTSRLPQGLYVYSIQSNNEHTTGNVVVAH